METDELNDILKSGKDNKKTELEILKELFDKTNIETKTDLNPNEIVLINQKLIISSLLDWDSLNYAIKNYMVLKISLSRKGRGEFVDGFKSDREQTIKKSGGFFDNMRGRLGFQ